MHEMTMNRREILKGLAGVPLAFLAGGVILPEAVTMEEREGSPLIVPSRRLEMVRPGKDAVVRLRMRISPNQQLVRRDVVIIDEGSEAWVHIDRQASYAIVELLIARTDDLFQIRVTTAS